MAHPEQLAFVKTLAENLSETWKEFSVLDIGSYDVNGSVRPFFPGADYIGVDLCAGPGVDVVGDGHSIDFGVNKFDVSVSCECFEHNPQWAETFLNMVRMTKPGGVVMVTCASTGRREHGTTRTRTAASPGTQSMGWDYYCNISKRMFMKRFDLKGTFSDYFLMYNFARKDLYFVGVKAGGPIFNRSIREIKPKILSAYSVTLSQKMRISLSNLPALTAFVLPDPTYQNIRLSWKTFTRRLRA
jgi:SAM-dependent methyltransferase